MSASTVAKVTHVGHPPRPHHPQVERDCGAEDGTYYDVTMAPYASCPKCLEIHGITFAADGRCSIDESGEACDSPLWVVFVGDDHLDFACSNGHGWTWGIPERRSYRNDAISIRAA